jgi:hypothetical protein
LNIGLQYFIQKELRGKCHFGDLGMDGRIILKEMCALDSFSSGYTSVSSSFKHGNDISTS